MMVYQAGMQMSGAQSPLPGEAVRLHAANLARLCFGGLDRFENILRSLDV
jgi:hypothetical protein